MGGGGGGKGSEKCSVEEKKECGDEATTFTKFSLAVSCFIISFSPSYWPLNPVGYSGKGREVLRAKPYGQRKWIGRVRGTSVLPFSCA